MTGDLTESTQQTLERVASQCAPENLLRALSEIYGKRAEQLNGRFDIIVSSYIDAALDRIQQKLPGNPTPYDFREAGLTIGDAVERRHEHSPGAPLHLIVDAVISDKVIEDRIRGRREARSPEQYPVSLVIGKMDGSADEVSSYDRLSRTEILQAIIRAMSMPGTARVRVDINL